LGAGYDTSYFILKTDEALSKTNFSYFEVDLAQVIKNKVKNIQFI
jgi:O-methyltransferase involved in polyketide biosynthesis